MNSFNQTNPIENYNQLLENIDQTKIKLKKIKKKLAKLIVLIQKYPQFNIMFINIMGYYKKYLGLLITINNNLKKSFEFIPFSNKFYDMYLSIYQNILIHVIEFEAIYKTKNEVKIQAYIDSISIEDFPYLFYFAGSSGDFQDKMADFLNLFSNKVRTFDSEEFKKELMEYFENLQNIIIEQINNLGKQVNTTPANVSLPPNKPLPPTPPVKKGGASNDANKFKKIFHPEKNAWVNVNSLQGMDALLKYASSS
jgi:hypothetical protein